MKNEEIFSACLRICINDIDGIVVGEKEIKLLR